MKLAELFKKKWWLFLAAGIVLVLCIVIILAVVLNAPKKLKVAFYGVEEKIVKNLSEEIKKAWPKEVEFTVLSEEDGFSVEKSGNYDAVITWSGGKRGFWHKKQTRYQQKSTAACQLPFKRQASPMTRRFSFHYYTTITPCFTASLR